MSERLTDTATTRAEDDGQREIALDSLRLDGGTQCRSETSREVVDGYAKAMKEGCEFPPITVFFDGEAYWLADGFYRTAAAKACGRKTILATSRRGTQRDAILYSVGANATHGQPRTNVDKRQAVTTLLGDAEWSQWSNREIAKRCAVAESFVRKLRKDQTLSAHGAQIARKATRLGTVYDQRLGCRGSSSPRRQEGVTGSDRRSSVDACAQKSQDHRVEEKLRRLANFCGATDVNIAIDELRLSSREQFLETAARIHNWLDKVAAGVSGAAD